MRIFSNYRCFENSKHVLTLKVERFEDFCLALTAEKGKDLGSIIGDRLCEESKTFVEINLSRKYGNPTANLLPRQSPPSSEGEFFNFLQRNLHEDTPLEYEYHLGGFYVRARSDLRTPEEIEFFKGIGHDLLCWLLSQIDASGESFFALEADGSRSADPATRTAQQKSLVNYYKKIGFKVCAKEEDHPRFYNSAVCMYGKFSDIVQKCNSRFDIKPVTIFDGF